MKKFHTYYLLLITYSFSTLVASADITFKYASNRADQLFALGEEAVITVTAVDEKGEKLTGGKLTATLDNYGQKVQSRTQVDLAKTNPFVVKGKLDEPGFLRLTMSGEGVNDKNSNSRWGVGYEPERIKAGGTCPEDFDSFWKAARENLAKTVPLDPRLELQPERSKGAFDFYRVSFATYGGTRVWGFMSVPKDKSKAPFPATVEVSSAGEGKWTIDMDGRPDRIRLYFTVHQFDPPRTLEENKRRHVQLREEMKAKYGITHYASAGLDGAREDYYFYRTILGIDRAVDWLWARPDVDHARFDYTGGSQGGCFGWFLCGLNRKFTSAVLRVPAGSDMRGSMAGRASGWPKPLKNFTGDKLAVATRNVGYFDGTSFAPRFTCPTCVTVGFVDNTCPPPSVYATYNLLGASERYILNAVGKGHCGQTWHTDEIAIQWQEQLRFLGHAPRVAMPEECTNPDGMAIAPDGSLAIAAPNNDRRRPGAVFRLDAPGRRPVKWFEVPVTADTGFASPMGICFGPEGELYVCDNQPDSKGRLLRITLRGEAIASCEIVAEGLENANGVKYLKGKLYLTQAFQKKCVRDDGCATSALYMFDAADRKVRVTNTAADRQRVFTEVTSNRVYRGGMNGVAVTKEGIVYAGNYGDGRIWKLTPGADGRFTKTELFAIGLVSADGLCTDAEGNLYCADMLGCAAVRFAPDGRKTVLAHDCYVKPSEPCVWKGALYTADYGSTTLTVCRKETK